MRNSALIFILVFFAVKISPQSGKRTPIPSSKDSSEDVRSFADSLRNDALLKIQEKRKSEDVVRKNEGYIANLDKKIKEIESSEKHKPSKTKKTLIAKDQVKEEITDAPSFKETAYTELYVPLKTCVENKRFIGRILSREKCRRYEIDTVKIQIQ